jgi:hypothetical protein
LTAVKADDGNPAEDGLSAMEASMNTNRVPPQHVEDNLTGCCPRFHPEDWTDVELHFRDKRFVRAETRSMMHVPLNMGAVFTRVGERMEAAGAYDPQDSITLSHELSPWKAEHLFAATKDVPEEEMIRFSADFLTRVFEGPYSKTGEWAKEMQEAALTQGKPDAEVWFHYPTCPKCAKVYGKNYVVGLAKV